MNVNVPEGEATMNINLPTSGNFNVPRDPIEHAALLARMEDRHKRTALDLKQAMALQILFSKQDEQERILAEPFENDNEQNEHRVTERASRFIRMAKIKSKQAYDGFLVVVQKYVPFAGGVP
jgi:hypothetical protein